LTIRLITNSPEETQGIGLLLGRLCQSGDVILLDGDLGTGKTCFVQGLAQGLEVDSTVTSPTFVLIAEYSGRLSLYHMDLYRLADGLVKFDLGLDEYFYGDGVTVVEWPKYGGEDIPAECIWLHFEHKEFDQRTIECSYVGDKFFNTFGRFRVAISDGPQDLLIDLD
jgi:tRNA threonylcarbamoyladenosine biosynthesis protein TsaE